MPLTQTQPFSDPPTRDEPANFSDRMDRTLLEIKQFQIDQNAQSNEVFNKAVEAIAAAQAIADLQNRYLGPFSQDPTMGFNGNPLTIGLLYFRTTAPQEIRIYTSAGWRGIGSYTAGSIDVTGYIKPATYLGTQSSFKNAPTANLLLNQFTSFVIETNRQTQLNFTYNPSFIGAQDSLEFRIDLITRAGHDVVFPVSVRWAGGGTSPNWNRPTFGSDSRSLINLYSSDSGVSWLAEAAVLNASADNAPTLV